MTTPAGSRSCEGAPVLEVDGVSRRFGRGTSAVQALDGVHCRVRAGETVGVLGVNGAGKTTLIKILGTLLLPTSGTARVDGHDVVRDSKAVRQRIGVVFGGDRGLYTRLTGRQNLRFLGTLDGVRQRVLRERVDRVLEQVGLEAHADRRVETYSKGMRQRLHMATVLVRDCRVLLLDEPTVGLDPIEAERLRKHIVGLQARGTTILLTSHYLADIERLAGRVLVLQGGRITHDMALEEFMAQSTHVAVARVRGAGAAPDAMALRAAAERAGLAAPDLEVAEGGWSATFPIAAWTPATLRALADIVPATGVRDLRVEPVTLEDVFADLAGAGAGV